MITVTMAWFSDGSQIPMGPQVKAYADSTGDVVEQVFVQNGRGSDWFYAEHFLWSDTLKLARVTVLVPIVHSDSWLLDALREIVCWQDSIPHIRKPRCVDCKTEERTKGSLRCVECKKDRVPVWRK